MVVVRPVRVEDTDAVVTLVDRAGHGLTSLPKDSALLRKRVQESCDSFGHPAEAPGGESYLLVLEDLETGGVVGLSGIVSKVGGFEPFYSYRVETHVYQSEALRVRKEIACLHLMAEHSGPCEIGSLFLSPDHRRRGSGRLLSLSRFLFMAEEPQRFEREIIAEMRGVVDERGHCPFWEGIGRHFFDIDFPKADYLSVKDKRFIAELMPTHPIYIAMLPEAAQAVVGQVHPQTQPALKLLQDEGFRYLEMVDIFDGGPVVGCPRREIRTVRESAVGRVEEIVEAIESEAFLIARARPEFRVCLGKVGKGTGDGVVIETAVARALEVEPGERVRFVPLRAGESQ
jgi:arginine N-succinyltransferase